MAVLILCGGGIVRRRLVGKHARQGVAWQAAVTLRQSTKATGKLSVSSCLPGVYYIYLSAFHPSTAAAADGPVPVFATLSGPPPSPEPAFTSAVSSASHCANHSCWSRSTPRAKVYQSAPLAFQPRRLENLTACAKACRRDEVSI